VAAEEPQAVTEYETLVAKVKELPEEKLLKLDFSPLRKAFFETPAMKRGDTLISADLKRSFDRAVASADYRTIISLGEQILAKDFTDLHTHVLKAHSHRKLNQKKNCFSDYSLKYWIIL